MAGADEDLDEILNKIEVSFGNGNIDDCDEFAENLQELLELGLAQNNNVQWNLPFDPTSDLHHVTDHQNEANFNDLLGYLGNIPPPPPVLPPQPPVLPAQPPVVPAQPPVRPRTFTQRKLESIKQREEGDDGEEDDGEDEDY